MTELEFLEKRVPFWIEGEDLKIMFPTNMDKMQIHSKLANKYNFNWLFIIRGYYWPGSHVMLYQGDYETPNCSTLLSQYLFNYFKDINWVGFGCIKGEIGKIWQPRIIIPKDFDMLKENYNDIFSK